MAKLVAFTLLFGKRRGRRSCKARRAQPHGDPRPRIRWYS
jgi:hypothetical protein